jgi:two-component system CheB/CheR fusion protein
VTVETATPLRVLLVEDHRDTAEMVAMVLRLAGHEVQTAGRAQAAIDAWVHGHFDIVVSDLGLPDASGQDLIRMLRALGCDLPALAVSGYGQEKDQEKSLQAGFDAFLVKPVDPAHLLEVMEGLARRHPQL